MNCYQAKTGELQKHWYVIDADIEGRRAAGCSDRADLDGEAPADVHAPHRHR